MKITDYWDCDICGHQQKKPIPEIPGSVVCMNCGFVFVPTRRPAEEIAHAWDNIWGENYTSAWPGVQARLTYVAEFCDQVFGWRGKNVLDVGAGEGDFLTLISERGARVTGVEPSPLNCQKLESMSIPWFCGPVEEFDHEPFDVITLLWTLENTGDCMGVLRKCHSLLKDDGLIVVATGSRILVPYKKPFHTYISDLPPDLHCFRFSEHSLHYALWEAGFGNTWGNDVRQNDAMIVIGKKGPPGELRVVDDPQEVLAYFHDWKEAFP